MEATSKPQAKSLLYAYVIHEREGKRHWTKIGIAHRNRDGSLNCHLDAVPTSGVLHIRESRDVVRDAATSLE